MSDVRGIKISSSLPYHLLPTSWWLFIISFNTQTRDSLCEGKGGGLANRTSSFSGIKSFWLRLEITQSRTKGKLCLGNVRMFCALTTDFLPVLLEVRKKPLALTTIS